MRYPILAAALAAGMLAGTPARAQFQTPESAIKYRQSAFSLMATHFSRIALMAQGITPFDAKVAAANAELVSGLSTLPFTAFTPGSDKGSPNRARPEIWKDAGRFKAASERMVAEVGKLDAAARSGNFEAIRAAASAVGSACKACHDDFRGSRSE